MFIVDESTNDDLERFEVLINKDGVAQVFCNVCDDLICDIDGGDTLGVLARTASDHICSGESA